MDDQIKCPNCGTKITISQALSKQVRAEIETKHQEELLSLEKKITEQKELFEEEKKAQENKLNKILAVKELEIKKEAQEKAEEKIGLELKDLKAQAEESKKRKEEMEDEILKERKRLREIEEQAKKDRLDLEKRLEEEKRKIVEEVRTEALKRADEEHRQKDMEKEKTISDMMRQIEELKRKAEQGSQQNQGEVLELDIEKKLKEKFVFDVLEEIGKGVAGADICQTVRSKTGASCGVILFEIKQTKNWSESWVVKFKDDLRKIKANIPVLVSMSLPKGMESFGKYKGIWVSKPNFLIALVTALRETLIATAYERSASEGKDKKSELLFNYVSSHEFRQRVEALVEIYQEMQREITKEKIAFEKSWAKRQKEIDRLLFNTAGIYGDMQGLVGSSMQEVKGLEFGEEKKQIESGQEELF